MGTLYIVSTPIGNLEDITIRAIKTLFAVDAIACEDTRRSGILLKHLYETYSDVIPEIQNRYQAQKLLSYYEQTEDRRIPEIENALLNNLSVALISDAGTPLVSDPGFPLVRELVSKGFPVKVIPGPSSVLSGLVLSGKPTDKFTFLGYPPKKGGNRKRLFESVKASSKELKVTYVLFEAPHKLVKTLEEMHEVLGNCEIVLARELTKVHEQVWRGKISDALSMYTKHNPKGEFVVLF